MIPREERGRLMTNLVQLERGNSQLAAASTTRFAVVSRGRAVWRRKTLSSSLSRTISDS